MSIDPANDQDATDPQTGEATTEDPRIREALELEERMRRALATKEDPLHDDESTSDRLRRLATPDDARD